MMIEMADVTNRGCVHEEEFILLMKEIGLISEPVVEIINNDKEEKRKADYDIALK